MNTSSLATGFAAAALFAAGLSAQGFDPNIGTPQSAGDDAIIANLALGFTFTMPDGTAVTGIDVDSNGRILPGSSGASSDFSESVGDLLAGPAAICGYWNDLNMSSASADDLYFNALPGKAVITWKDAVVFGDTNPFTVQVQLFADNRISFYYDNRVVSSSSLTGLSDGNGAADPGESDFSSGFVSSPVPTIYELFAGDLDIADSTILFAPNATGGYDAVFASTAARIEAGRVACGAVTSPQLALTFSPDGSGGYNQTVAGSFDANFASGTPLGLGDDSLSGPLALGFSFPAPGGNVVTDIEVDSNGRVIEVGTDFSDFSESTGELLNNLGFSICPFWTDLNPSSLGEVWFLASATEASITWDGVPTFGGSQGMIFQVRLFANGDIQLVYPTPDDLVATSVLVGVSGGNGIADPGASDLTAGSASAGIAAVYELFAAGTDFNATRPVLSALTNPVIGTNFDLGISGQSASASADFFLIGLPVDIPLDILSNIGLAGCRLLSDGLVFSFSTAAGTPLSLALPNDTNLIGLRVECQGASVDLTSATPVQITDSLGAVLGT